MLTPEKVFNHFFNSKLVKKKSISYLILEENFPIFLTVETYFENKIKNNLIKFKIFKCMYYIYNIMHNLKKKLIIWCNGAKLVLHLPCIVIVKIIKYILIYYKICIQNIYITKYDIRLM